MYRVIRPKEPLIETERLVLRPLTVADAQAVFKWGSDPRVNRFMAYPLAADVETERQWIASNDEEWAWGICLKSSGQLIGTGAVKPSADEAGYWEMGYNIRYDCWGNGYTTEAMKAILNFAREELSVKKICSKHAVDNPASGRVMEKCGLRFKNYCEYSKLDGSETFKAKLYTLEL